MAQQLGSDDPAVRLAAIHAAGGNLGGYVRMTLTRLAGDETLDEETRDAAAAALQRIQAKARFYELLSMVFFGLSMGEALSRLLEDLGVAGFGRDARHVPFAGAFAAAAAHWAVPPAEAAAGYAWAWCESQAAAAIKLVPLGHTAGQRLMLGLGPAIEAAVDAALRLDDDEIGFGMPGLAIASARHETQYTRLFRS